MTEARDSFFGDVFRAALEDSRLTGNQLRVLLGLLSFWSKKTNRINPKREALSRRCGGIAVCKLSTATTELEKMGWIRKVGNGGKSKSNEYLITIPERQTVPETVTVTDLVTVTETVTQTVTEIVTVNAPNRTQNGKGQRSRVFNEVEKEVENAEALTKIHDPLALPDAQASRSPSETKKSEETSLARQTVCSELASLGFVKCTPTHPILGELVEAGVSVENFIAVAREVLGRGVTSFPYVIATIKGRIEEGTLANKNYTKAAKDTPLCAAHRDFPPKQTVVKTFDREAVQNKLEQLQRQLGGHRSP